MAYTTINKSSEHFNTKLYTGNGSTQSITGVGFQPDLLWQKSRSNAYGNMWFDAVRGASQRLMSNSTGGQGLTVPDSITSFDSDGFSLGADVAVNGNGTTNVAWNWKANGAGSANTDGTISSTVSANTTSGFSIVSYTGNGSAGATVGHGLGSVPKMMIIKQYSSNGGSENWAVYHHEIGNTDALYLSATNSVVGSNLFWNNTTPSSTLFTLGSGDHVNNNTVSYIAYCFADVTGYSKFGSYVGNGNADGTFVYTGFKPAWVMMKITSGADNWIIQDNKRNPFNISTSNRLRANTSGAEFSSSNPIDLYSNGFKAMSGSDGEFNGSGSTYIYMAFAEAPLVGTNGVTAKAR